MSLRVERVLAGILAVGLVLSLASAALAAPVGALKQFKVPIANSQPRAIANGSDGNLWFTEGTEFTGAPAKVGRITPDGSITEFDANCNFCILTDIVQGPADILYMTSNNPILLRFSHSPSRTGSARGPSPSLPMARSGSLPGSCHKASVASTRPTAW
jgi:streptogramin lyase